MAPFDPLAPAHGDRPAEAGILWTDAEYAALILAHTSDLVCLLDDAAHYVYASPSHQPALGYEPGALIGRRWFDLIHPDDIPALQAQWPPSEVGATRQATVRFCHADGTWRWLETRGTLIVRDGAHSIVEVATDITERKRLEAHLLQAQKMESVGRLAGGLAHDFNNLLTAIVGYAELGMQELPLDSLIRSDLDEILIAARRASTLTRQLLAFARKQPLAPRVLNLNDLLLEMDRLLRRLLGADIELVSLPALDAAYVRADPGQIEQVLVNLAINARDAMPEGGTLTVAIGTVAVDQADTQAHGGMTAGDYVCMSISDTGKGMSLEVQAHLFEPFFTTKEQGKGTGLGLATCYGIIRRHGGAIRVDSALDQGTTISIYLPQVVGAGTLAAYAPADGLPRGTETILLVEDEPAVRVLAARVLREQGYRVLEAGHGAEALQVAHSYGLANIGLLLTDVVMPQMGGVALAEQLADLRPDIKVLFMSGYTDNVLIQHDRLGQGGMFLQKPFPPGVLVRKVREVLDAA